MSVCGEIATEIIGSAQALALFAQPANRLTTTRVGYRNKAGNYAGSFCPGDWRLLACVCI